MRRVIYLEPIEGFPAQWDDLVDEEGRTYVTISTLESAKRDIDVESPGIIPYPDDKFDIVLDVPEITEDMVRESLKELSKITGMEYILK